MVGTRMCDICNRDVGGVKYIVDDDLYVCYYCNKTIKHKALARDFVSFLRENKFKYCIALNGDIVVEIKNKDIKILNECKKVIVDKFFELFLKHDPLEEYQKYRYIQSSTSVFKMGGILYYLVKFAFTV